MMEIDANVARFFFNVGPLPAGTLAVTRFSYTEELSRLFRCEVELLSDDPSIDFDDVAGQLATFTMKRGNQDVLVQGVVADFRQEGRTQTDNFYRAVLRPRLWMLTLNFRSHLYQKATVKEILFEVLERNGFVETIDFRFEFLDEAVFKPREYCVQYRERDFDFICRMMEEEGISFFFVHDDERDILVITDDQSKFPLIESPSAITYNDTGGFAVGGTEVARSFTCRQQMIPQQVLLKDYNPETPEIDLTVESALNGEELGDFGLYYDCGGEHYQEPPEGARLAKIRHQELLCRRRVMEGQSTCMGLRAGHKLEVTSHFRADFNDTYLLLSVTHEGSQLEAFPFLISGLGPTELTYKNTFECILQTIVFRPERKTPKPEIAGVIPVRSDRKDEPYANLDDQGRYKTKLLFDLEEREPMEGSLPIRKSQIYSGEGYGVHFASHKDKDMLLTCINGDPNRPVIAGEMPNPVQVTPVTQANQWQNVIRTWGQNELTFDDKQGEENIYMHATKDHTVQVTNDESISVGHDQSVSVGNDQTITVGHDRTKTVHAKETVTVEKSQEYTVHEGQTYTVTEGRTVNVSGGEGYTIHGGATRTVYPAEGMSANAELVTIHGPRETTIHNMNLITVLADGEVKTITGDTQKTVTGKLDMTSTEDMLIRSDSKITLQVGNSNIEITSSKISINSQEIELVASPTSNIKVKPDGIDVGSPKIGSHAIGVHEVTGAVIKIN